MTYNETKASVVERFNRTLKTKMWKYFTANNTRHYLTALPKLMTAYNTSFHRSIGRAPATVNVYNADAVRKTLYPPVSAPKHAPFRFNVGDTIRINVAARPFKKGYLPNWTDEIFTVSARIARKPPVYRLRDYCGEELLGTFYEQELQRVVKKGDLYKIERVLAKRKRKGKTEYFVKWLGYPDKFNSWVPHLLSV